MFCWDTLPQGSGTNVVAEQSLVVPSDGGPLASRSGLSDGGPLERMAALCEREAMEPGVVMEEVCARVLEGSSLAEVAKDWGLPRHRFMVWVSGDDERRAQYEGALRLRADELVHESLMDAGEMERAGHKLKVAGLWDRARFGRGDSTGTGIKVVVMRFSESSMQSADSSVTLDGTLDGTLGMDK